MKAKPAAANVPDEQSELPCDHLAHPMLQEV